MGDPRACQICGDVAPGEAVAHCPECAHLLRWVRGYFAHVPGLETHIRPETTFRDLGADSLDWMDWLVEAEGKLGIKIPDEDAGELNTVGEFLRYLRARGASWPSDYDIRLRQKGGCFRNYVWVKDHRDRQRRPVTPGASGDL